MAYPRPETERQGSWTPNPGRLPERALQLRALPHHRRRGNCMGPDMVDIDRLYLRGLRYDFWLHDGMEVVRIR